MKNGGDVVTVGQNVARLRKEARLSQRELAEAMLRLKRLEASLLVCLEDVRDLLSAKVEDR